MPIFKKGNRSSKDNYRPVSILPNLSKIFERCIFRQLYSVISIINYTVLSIIQYYHA